MDVATTNKDDDDSRSSLNTASLSMARQQPVEIAILSMPQAAAEAGVEAGVGTDFVLEAPSFVVDQLVECEETIAGQRHDSPNANSASIEGIVDLGMISHLVTGINEGEFISLLQKDFSHAHARGMNSPSQPNKRSSLETIAEGKYSNDNLHRDGDISGKKPGSEEHMDEEKPLLKPNRSEDSNACVVVSADPFVQTLAHVYEHLDDESIVRRGSVDRSSELSGSFRLSQSRGDNIYQTEDFHGMAVSSEAFLLSVPTARNGDAKGTNGSHYNSGDGGNDKSSDNVFVLALPEMSLPFADDGMSHANTTFRSSLASSATAMMSAAADEVFPFFEHTFAPLPSDVRNIELRVSTATAYFGDGRTSGLHSKDLDDMSEMQAVHLDVVVDRSVPMIGYVLLVSGLFALSSSGVVFDLQEGPSAEMKTLWRFILTTVVFFFLAAKSFKREEFARFSLVDACVWMPLAGINYAFMCTAFVVALELTTLVNAFILANLASLIIIGCKFVMGHQVLLFEGIGALVGFAGALICTSAPADSDDSGAPSDGHLAMLGNIIAFLASVSTAMYLTLAKKLRPKVDIFLFMFILFTISSTSLFVYMKFAGQPVEMSFHPNVGLFGWMNPELDRLPLELYSAIVCNVVGTAGYIAIMKYFDPVVVSMVMLMEPIVASFMGAAVGVSSLPGWITWAGDAVVVLGSAMVISSGAKKTESIDATDALHNFEREVDSIRGSTSTKTSFTLKSSLLSSPLVRSSLIRNGKYSGGLTKSPLMRYPRLVNNQVGKDVEMVEEAVFQSVKDKARSISIGGSGHRVVWN